MVFFTCNACGESLKKAQVDKHVNMCRGCQVLSCIDCGKDFWGSDYKNHVKCISEDQKYGGKSFEARSNKGDVKQQLWIQVGDTPMEKIHDAANKPGISSKLKDVLNQVSTYDNVPRKKAKFQNWMNNSLRISNPKLHDEVWEIFSAATTAEASKPNDKPKESVAEVKEETNGTPEEGVSQKKKLNKRERKEARQQKNGKVKKDAGKSSEELEEGQSKKKKDKKRKLNCEEDKNGEQNGCCAGNDTCTKRRKKHKDESEDGANSDVAEESEEQALNKGKFNWKGTTKAALRQSPEQELSVKKLRKKVLAAYYSFMGERNFKSEEELLALFNKKINGNPKFKVLKDKVRLLK